MSTGIETWKNLADIGPIYPFVGTEVILTVVGVVLWIAWHVLQISAEKEHHEEAASKFKRDNGG